MLPVFVINLDRRPDRWECMRQQLDRLGIEATRIPAVDARILDPDTGDMNAGETACVLSHCAALRSFLRTDRHAALILEDDVKLAADIPSLLAGTEWWPVGAGLLKLDNWREKPRVIGRCVGRTPSGRGLHRVMLSQSGGAAYLLGRHTATAVLASCRAPSMPMDLILFDLRRSKTARRLRPLQVVPAMALQDDDVSDIDPWRQAQGSGREPWARGRRAILASLAQKARVLLLRACGLVRRYPINFEDR